MEILTPRFELLPSVDPDGDSVKYHFEIYADELLTQRIAYEATASLHWSPEASLENHTTYYWRARAEDEHGTYSLEWSEPHSFFVNEGGINDPPSFRFVVPQNPLRVSGRQLYLPQVCEAAQERGRVE